MNTQKQQKYIVYEYQIGGRTIMLRSEDGSRVYKKILKQNQYIFYKYIQQQNINHPYYKLNQFIPKCYQLIRYQVGNNDNRNINHQSSITHVMNVHEKIHQWYNRIKQNTRNHRNQAYRLYLQMQNFTNGFSKLNIIDLKVGKLPKRTQNKLALKMNIKIVGVLKTYQNGVKQFQDRTETGTITTYEKMKLFLCWFFSNYQGQLMKAVVYNIIDKLKDLYLNICGFKGWEFFSSSVCIFYDAEIKQQRQIKSQIKMIDFGRVKQNQMNDQYDKCVANGLVNLIKTFQQIIENQQKYKSKYQQAIEKSIQNYQYKQQQIIQQKQY